VFPPGKSKTGSHASVRINEMKACGAVERYAIGDAVGATFYLEPVATLDVDVFVSFQSEADAVSTVMTALMSMPRAVCGSPILFPIG